MKLFASPYRWIVTSARDTKEEIIHLFEKIDILVDSDVTIVTQNYTLMKTYKITRNTPLIFEQFGFWGKKVGLHITEREPIIARRRKDLLGISLNTCIVITNNDTLNHLTDKRYNNSTSFIPLFGILSFLETSI